jgi:hypothetical protein
MRSTKLFLVIMLMIPLAGLLPACATVFDRVDTGSCLDDEGCLTDMYQYQMMSVDPKTGQVTTGPTPVPPSQNTPQNKTIEGTQGGAVK